MRKLLIVASVIALLASCSENKKTENPAPASAVKREGGKVMVTGKIFARVAGDTINLGSASSSSQAREKYLDTLSNASIPFKKFRIVTPVNGDIKLIAIVQNVDLNLTNTSPTALENQGVTIINGIVNADGSYSVEVPVGPRPTDIRLELGSIDRTLSIDAKVTVGSSVENIKIEIPTRHFDNANQVLSGAIRGQNYSMNIEYDVITRSDRN
ncbi:MAG: hypothetical protein NZM38_05465 [Cytophagales bacterium]|nr:hypothetical protein [Cytophagales bacterium]MDW8384203.1 hypothetical protein [Flammeovirgaceae bacterium]